MSDRLPEELLSAYLDDELSAPERAEVEQYLREHVEARKLLGELRRLRGLLKDLPQQQLDESFQDRVLRSAERAMLAGASPPRPASHIDGQRDAIDRQASRRRWVWPLLAVAAALLVMVFTRQPAKQEQPVALLERRLSRESEVSPLRDEAARRQQSDTREKDRAAASADSAAGEKVRIGVLSDSSDRLAGPSLNPQADGQSPRAGQSAAARDAAAAESPAEAGADRIQPTRPAAEPPSQVPLSKRQRLAAQAAPRDAMEGEPKGLMIVSMQVEPSAFASGSLKELLSSNGIAFRSIGTDTQTGSDGPTLGAGSEQAPITAGRQEKKLQAIDALRPEGSEAVYVEGSKERIEKVLRQLKARPQEFPALQVTLGDNVPRQDDFAAYRWGGVDSQQPLSAERIRALEQRTRQWSYFFSYGLSDDGAKEVPSGAASSQPASPPPAIESHKADAPSQPATGGTIPAKPPDEKTSSEQRSDGGNLSQQRPEQRIRCLFILERASLKEPPSEAASSPDVP